MKLNMNQYGSEINSFVAVDDHVEIFQVMRDSKIVEEVKNVEAEDSAEEAAKQKQDTYIIYLTLQEALKSAETHSRFYHYKETEMNEVQYIYRTPKRINFMESQV